MPWTLTTPVAVGDLDPSGPYTEVRIVRQSHDSVRRAIIVHLEYGNTVDGVWKSGIPARDRPASVIINSADYDELVADSEPVAGEKTYGAVKRGLYEYLLEKNVIGPGTLT